jgi:hypothetical protein
MRADAAIWQVGCLLRQQTFFCKADAASVTHGLQPSTPYESTLIMSYPPSLTTGSCESTSN